MVSATVDSPTIAFAISGRKKPLHMPSHSVCVPLMASVACFLKVSTSIQLDQAFCTPGSSNSGSWAKPRPFSCAQRFAI